MIGKMIPFFTGESSSYTPTSSYASFAYADGIARNLVFEVYLASTGRPIDFRLVQGMPRLGAQTSSIRYLFPSTTYTQKSSSFTINITKGCYSFALQARQSTNSTKFDSSDAIKAKWIGIG